MWFYGIYILTNGKVMVTVRSIPAAEDEKASSSHLVVVVS